METDRELILEDDRSIQEELWRIAQLAQDARIEEENLEVLERVQSFSLGMREELDAYQQRHLAVTLAMLLVPSLSWAAFPEWLWTQLTAEFTQSGNALQPG